MSSEKNSNLAHVDAASEYDKEKPRLNGFLSDVQDATDGEHNMSLIEALRTYPKAAAWSVALSASLVMEGYDMCILGSLYGFPSFTRKFGTLTSDGTYEVSASWQAGLQDASNASSIVGLMLTGYMVERFGYRKVIFTALVAIAAVIFLQFFAQNMPMLQVAYIFIGVPWGVFQTSTTAYASDVCPVRLRPYLTTYVNLCWVMGQLIASGVMRGFSTAGEANQMAWRIPYAIQWIWPVPIATAVWLAPESPWWLIRHSKFDEAQRSLLRLTSRKQAANFDVTQTIAMMKHTNELEKAAVEGTSYSDCFRGVNFRRTEIACAVWMAQQLCGSVMMGYSTYFFIQAGLAKTAAFNMSMGMYAVGAMGTVLSWVLMSHFGRRTLYTVGTGFLGAIMLLIGIIAVATKSSGGSWAIGALLVIFTGIYDATVGPVCYCLVPEMSTTRLRPKTIVLSRALYNATGIVVGTITPYMLNPTAWNWKGKAGFFWAVPCIFITVYCYFRLPEPSGRTYGEIDILFEHKVSARNFSKTEVNAAEGTIKGAKI